MQSPTRFISTAIFLSAPLMAQAYVGPGAGLSALGALWALVLALFTAVFFVLAWPVRRALRRRRAARQAEGAALEDDEATAEGVRAAASSERK